MQVITTSEAYKYSCPLMIPRTFCKGPTCMWWSYITVTELPRVQRGNMSVGESKEDRTRGYCGK